jgi:hypothetical protein
MPWRLPTLLALLAGALGACRLAAPTDEAWLAVGFRTPRQTFATFQTALRADDPHLEYRCLAQGLKAREGLNELAYRTFREDLFRENPWLKFAAEGQVVGESRPSEDRCTLVAEVTKILVKRTFVVRLVREDYYELYSGGELLDDGFASFERSLSSPAAGELEARLPLPAETDVRTLSEVRLGREWKIDSFAEVAGSEEAAAP